MCIEAGTVCAEEGARGMACVDGGKYVRGQMLRGVSCGCRGHHPVAVRGGGCLVAVEEVVIIWWMYAGDSKLAEKTGRRAFCREEVVGNRQVYRDEQICGTRWMRMQAGRFWLGNGQVCRDERIWDDGRTDNRGKE